MKLRTFIVFLSLLVSSCKSESTECECQDCIEEKNRNNTEYKKPDSFDEKNKVLLNLLLDTNFLKKINSDTLKPHPVFPGCINDTGHEGYPTVLNNLNYFLIQEWNLSEKIKLKLLYGELPKNSKQKQVYYYRALYFATFDKKGNHIDTKVVGKRMIVSKTGDTYESVFTSIENNSITISTHERWHSASGRFYSLWSDKNFVITKNGYIIEWPELSVL